VENDGLIFKSFNEKQVLKNDFFLVNIYPFPYSPSRKSVV
jgi:hypothetical protein